MTLHPVPISSTPSQTISVLLVDDNPSFRHGLQALLDFYSGNGPSRYQVVGQATSVEQAVKLTIEQSPTLVLLDMELGQSSGLTFLQTRPKGNERVLVLSAHREDEWVFRAMQAGASGYLFKTHLAERLWPAITTVLKDQIYLSPEVATGFFRLFQFYNGGALTTATIPLTEREQEVLHWLVQGASNNAIAQRLHITVATVKAHLTAIFEKLEVSSRTQAIVKALKLGLVAA
ncbi:response regulator transcription factor [Leptolyngbya sp. PCC 6406]|uniref:response regulator transcription factor n=1 Tax=Leptolyngbya sp. PCC 6406 TaxID=1173264 RepID=UPI0002AC12CE|nr:response regulator transcription factor [Leptolyngbya sp. PCC 6406]